MKLGRHMYPYMWQLSAKFGKFHWRQRKVIAKNDEFTMHYVIARLTRAVHCAQMTMVSNRPQWSALLNDTKHVIRYHRKLWVTRIWTRITIRIPPSFRPIITRIGYDVIFSDCFSPPKRSLFSLKIGSDITNCNTQGTLRPDLKIG